MSRILFILHLPPPVHGASLMGSFLKQSLLIKKNHETEFLDLGTAKSLNEMGQKGVKKLRSIILLHSQIFSAIRRHKPELIYLTMNSAGIAFYKDAIIALRILNKRIPLLIHFHNKGVYENSNKILDNWLYKKTLGRSKVILLSEHLYPDISKYVKKESVFIAPNGIPDHGSINRDFRGSNPIKILFLSNLLEAKGVFVLLAACKLLQEEGVEFTCDFVGGEGDITKSEFEKRVEKMKLSERVKFLGPKYENEKWEMYESADIFAFPTLNDCFALVLLEAMMKSLPIVATFEGGIPDVIEDNGNGFLIPKNDVEALYEKLVSLIKDPTKRARFGNHGRLRYEERFTEEKFEKRINNILQEALNN